MTEKYSAALEALAAQREQRRGGIRDRSRTKLTVRSGQRSMKSARRETTSMAEAGRVFVNNKAGGKKQTSSLRERERERSQPHFHRLRMELTRHPRGGGNGDLAGAVREAQDQGMLAQMPGGRSSSG